MEPLFTKTRPRSGEESLVNEIKERIKRKENTQMKLKNIPFAALLIMSTAFLISSCTEKVDIKLANNKPRLVVEGTITDEAMEHTVRLTTTTDYFYTQAAPAVSGAIVTVNDGTTQITLTEKPANSGIYVTPSNYAGVPGKTYQLKIDLPQAINGQTHYEASETMPQANHPDSIKLVYHADWGKKGFWEIQLYAQDPPQANYYSFRGYRNDTLVTDTLSKVTTTDDQFFNGRYMHGVTVMFWNQEYSSTKIKTGDRVKLQSGSITKGYFHFLDDLRQEVEPKNPLFSGPSSNVSTNITNGGFGYFAVYTVGYATTTVK